MLEPGNQIVQDNLVLCAGGWPRLLAMLIQCLKREERQEDLEQRGFGYQKLPDLVLSLVKSMEEARLPPMPSSETVEKILSLRRHQGGRVPDALQFWSKKMPQVRGMVESGMLTLDRVSSGLRLDIPRRAVLPQLEESLDLRRFPLICKMKEILNRGTVRKPSQRAERGTAGVVALALMQLQGMG